jgi:uncharacterized protein involved in exopolysaccharide biosynthesis
MIMNDLSGYSFEPGAQKPARPGLPVDPYRIRRALWRGRYWLLAATLFGLGFGFFYAKVLMGQVFETVVVLKYEGDTALGGNPRTSGYALGPAAEALHREPVLKRIRKEIGADVDLFTLAAAIVYDVDIRAGIMRISVARPDPQESADFAHLVTDVFLRYHQERQARRIEEEIARVAERIEGAHAEAAEARRRYNAFREKHGIAHLSTEHHSMVDSAAGLRADSELATAEIRALEVQVQSLEEQLRQTPKVSTVVGGSSPEQAALDQLRRELATAQATLSPDHPRVQSLRQQVAQLQSQGRRNVGSGLVGANATYLALSDQLRTQKAALAALRERQKGLSSLASKAQERVESFSGLEGEASALLAEVEVNEALLSRLQAKEAELEDALERPPSGFSVLEPGSVPENPIKNKMKPVAFGIIAAVSMLLGLALVLWREFRGLKMRTATEIAYWAQGPVVGVTSWPTDPDGLDELVAGLDDFAPDTRGSFLIVGGSAGQERVAHEFADRMNRDWFVDGPGAGPQPQPQPRGYETFRAEPTPITTPPPTGPYPVGGRSSPAAAPSRPSTALALRPVQLVLRDRILQLEAWDGPFEGQALRRAARLADRVVVLVRSGAMTSVGLHGIKSRLGRKHGVGFVIVDLPEDLQALPDRVGDVAAFWAT